MGRGGEGAWDHWAETWHGVLGDGKNSRA